MELCCALPLQSELEKPAPNTLPPYHKIRISSLQIKKRDPCPPPVAVLFHPGCTTTTVVQGLVAALKRAKKRMASLQGADAGLQGRGHIQPGHLGAVSAPHTVKGSTTVKMCTVVSLPCHNCCTNCCRPQHVFGSGHKKARAVQVKKCFFAAQAH